MAIAAAAAIAWFTLRPDKGGIPAATGRDYLLTDLVLNVLLFMPLGVGLALTGLGNRVAVIVGTLSSAAIEFAQWHWIAGRSASVHDVVTNGLGTALGALLVAGWGERERWRRTIGLPLATALTAAWVIGGLLVAPSLPRRGVWFGQWAHEFAGTTQFQGRVLGLEVNGTAVPDGPFAGTEALRERLARSATVRTTAEVITGPLPDGRAQLVGVTSAKGEELASLWQVGTSILARQRLRLSDLTVRTLWLRLDQALPPQAGDTIRVFLEATVQSLQLQVEGGQAAKVSRVRLSPEIFWTGFLPFEYEAGARAPWWPLTGVILIFLVLGFLLAPHRAAAFAALALNLLIAPLIGRTAIPSVPVMLAAVCGMGAGTWLARRLE